MGSPQLAIFTVLLWGSQRIDNWTIDYTHTQRDKRHKKKLKKLKATKITAGGEDYCVQLSLFSRPRRHAHSQSQSRDKGKYCFGLHLLLYCWLQHVGTSSASNIHECTYTYVYLRSCHMCCTDIVVDSRGEVATPASKWWGYPKCWLPGRHPPNRKLPKIVYMFGILSPPSDLHLHR